MNQRPDALTMNALAALFLLVMTLAFIGVGIYTVVGGWHMTDAADFSSRHRPTRQEMMERIPPHIRKLGKISIAVFIGGLTAAAIVSFLFG